MLIVRQNISDTFFYMFLISMFVCKGFGLYDGQLIYKWIFLFSMICIVGKVVMTDFTLLEWFFICALGLLAIIINRVSGEKGPLIVAAILIGIKNVPLEKIFKVGTYSFGISLLVNMVISFISVPNTVHTAMRFGIPDAIRWTLGQPHPNTTSVSFLVLLSLLILLSREKINTKHAIGFGVGIAFVTLFCVSYTGLILSSLLVGLSFVATFMQKKDMKIPWIVELLLPACILFSVIIPFVRIPIVLESFLEENLYTLYHRIILSRNFFSINNLYVFGVHVSELSSDQFSLDNSYLYCIVFNGVIFFVLLMIGYIYMIHKYRVQKRYYEIAIIVTFLCEGILEPFLFNTSFKNITLFFVGECIWTNVSKWCEKDLKKRNFCIFQDKELQIQIPTAIGIAKTRISNVFLELKDGNRYRKVGWMICTIGGIVAGIIRLINPHLFAGVPDYHIDFWVQYGFLRRVMLLEHLRFFIAYWFIASLVFFIAYVVYMYICNVRSDGAR